MLQTDEIITQILLQAKQDGNELLQHFKIGYPSNQVAEESNSIFIASVDSENHSDGFDFNTFTDLVEVLIVTKNKEYLKAIQIIKVVSKEIIKLIMCNRNLFDNKPIIRNVTPEYNRDYVLTRGHIMIQVTSSPEQHCTDDEKQRVCQILIEDMDVDIK